MKKLLSFKRDEQASNVAKIILVVWLAFLGMNRDKLFNDIELVPVEVEQSTTRKAQSVDVGIQSVDVGIDAATGVKTTEKIVDSSV